MYPVFFNTGGETFQPPLPLIRGSGPRCLADMIVLPSAVPVPLVRAMLVPLVMRAFSPQAMPP